MQAHLEPYLRQRDFAPPSPAANRFRHTLPDLPSQFPDKPSSPEVQELVALVRLP